MAGYGGFLQIGGLGTFNPQGYRGTSSLGGGVGPLRLGGSIGGSPDAGFLPFAQQAQAQQQAAAEQERQRQAAASAAAAEAERQRQAAAAAEAERLRIRGLEQAGAFTKAAWRYAGSLAIPAAAATAPIGSRFQQSLVIPTGSPAGSAASAVGSRRQLMIERRQQLASTTADPMGSNYNRAFAIPGTGG